MLTFQESILKEELGSLPRQSRVAFAASCAQRLMNTYRAFAERSGQCWTKLEGALDYVWASILNQPNDKEAKRMLEEVMTLMPDEEEPGWTPLLTYASDAVSAVAYSLRCLISDDAQEAAWAARRVYEALDHLVTYQKDIAIGESNANRNVLCDPAIQAELLRQRRDMDELRAAGTLSPEVVASLRDRSSVQQAITLRI